jgi:hypothetical protein
MGTPCSPISAVALSQQAQQQISYLAPPGALMVQPDDQITIYMVDQDVPGLEVDVSIRYLSPEGVIVPQLIVLQTDGLGVFQQQFAPTQAGYIAGVAVQTGLTATGVVQSGKAYVIVGLWRGAPNSGTMYYLFCEGYITQTSNLGWPNGPQAFEYDGPGWPQTYPVGFGLGMEATFGPLSNVNALIQSVSLRLTTSAAAGNRRVRLHIGPAALSLGSAIEAQFDQPPSTDAIYQFFPGCGFAGPFAPLLGQLWVHCPLPPGWRTPASIVQTRTVNLDAGDLYGMEVGVEQWLQVG